MRSLVKGLITLNLVLTCTNTNLAYAAALFATPALSSPSSFITVGTTYGWLKCHVSNVSATVSKGTITLYGSTGTIYAQTDFWLDPYESDSLTEEISRGHCVVELTEGSLEGTLVSLETLEGSELMPIRPNAAVKGEFIRYTGDPVPPREDDLTN